jgi:hypothetical protein
VRYVRAAVWSLCIGVLALLLAVPVARAVGFAFPVFILSIATVSALATLLVELHPAQGAAGGAVAAILVILVLRMTSPDPPLLTLSISAALLSVAAGFLGVLAASRWRRHDGR